MKNNRHALVAGVLILVCVTALSAVFICAKKKMPKSAANAKGFAVVELFTSEGCSSCPAADAVVARLENKNLVNTYVLSFHVDYWNRLGWTDPFSHAFSSERQRQYATHLALEGVYTPQVVVNGAQEFVGSKEGTLNNTVNTSLSSELLSNLQITAVKSGNTVIIDYTANSDVALLLNTAIVLPKATTVVKRGENGGSTLEHVNIVAGFTVTQVKGSGQVKMDIPKAMQNGPFKVIAYTQSKQSFKVLGAASADL